MSQVGKPISILKYKIKISLDKNDINLSEQKIFNETYKKIFKETINPNSMWRRTEKLYHNIKGCSAHNIKKSIIDITPQKSIIKNTIINTICTNKANISSVII